VALTLKRRGIRAVRPLAGGFEWWQHRNYPLAAAAGTAAARWYLVRAGERGMRQGRAIALRSVCGSGAAHGQLLRLSSLEQPAIIRHEFLQGAPYRLLEHEGRAELHSVAGAQCVLE